MWFAPGDRGSPRLGGRGARQGRGRASLTSFLDAVAVLGALPGVEPPAILRARHSALLENDLALARLEAVGSDSARRVWAQPGVMSLRREGAQRLRAGAVCTTRRLPGRESASRSATTRCGWRRLRQQDPAAPNGPTVRLLHASP
jgi:hypothetical protein